jgi:hypothetical protein
MAIPRDRYFSFVWDELGRHLVVSIRTMLIGDHHLFVTGDVVTGTSPETCVPGSGLYKCRFREAVFELYLRYCEPIGPNRWVLYVDHERNRRKRELDSLS